MFCVKMFKRKKTLKNNTNAAHKTTQLLDLPFDLLREIFEQLSYDEVAQSRAVCKSIDTVCRTILNAGFKQAKQQHVVLCKRNETLAPQPVMPEVLTFFLRLVYQKAQPVMASRSSRQTGLRHGIDAEELPPPKDNQTQIQIHPQRSLHQQPATAYDIVLDWLGTALELLSQIYDEYIQLNLSCFVPGLLLDKIFFVINALSAAKLEFCILSHLEEILQLGTIAFNHFNNVVRKETQKELILLERSICQTD